MEFSIRHASCCLVVAAFLVACQPSPALPVTGEIRLEFNRKAESDIYFELTNQTSRAISLRGTYKKEVGVNPWDAWMKCSPAGSDLWVEGPYALVDGGRADV